MLAFAPGIQIPPQDPANRLLRLWRRPSWRRCAAVISAVAFCASERAEPFLQGGSVARLWSRGDAQALCEAISAVTPGADEIRRTVVCAHFDRELSLDELGRKLVGMYRGMVGCAASAAHVDPERCSAQ